MSPIHCSLHCRRRHRWHFLILTAYTQWQWRPVVAMFLNVKKEKKSAANITRLHTASAMSSKCLEGSAVQFVSTWWSYHHVFSQNIHSSLLATFMLALTSIAWLFFFCILSKNMLLTLLQIKLHLDDTQWVVLRHFSPSGWFLFYLRTWPPLASIVTGQNSSSQ